jgi:hypothetical protein
MYVYLYLYICAVHTSTADNITTANNLFLFRKRKKLGGGEICKSGAQTSHGATADNITTADNSFFSEKKGKN